MAHQDIMASLLIQSLYNIVDSIFVAKLREDALTAASLAFPIQMLMIADHLRLFRLCLVHYEYPKSVYPSSSEKAIKNMLTGDICRDVIQSSSDISYVDALNADISGGDIDETK